MSLFLVSLIFVSIVLAVSQLVAILFLWNMATKADKEIEKQMQGIGKRIKELRKEKHSNYEHFAYENDLNRVQYGRYENGKDLRMSSFLKILKALKISPKDFFGVGFD